ncbi:MAG: methyltransferase, partial [Desulfobacterales bacterium]|nr:methyltransferase [Desulfobacterales bacterium]
METPPPVAMLQMMSGFWISRGIYIVAKLGIADHVKDGSRSAEELADLTSAHAPSLYRLLRMLAGVGIFAEDENGRFGLTPLASTLQSDVPGSLRSFAIAEMGEDHYDAWGMLMHSVKTGEISFDRVFGMDVWDYYAQNPEIGGVFADAMNNMTNMENAAIIDAEYDFSSIDNLVDVGGGVGGLLISILKANPAMKGVLLDQAHVVEEAKRNIEAEGVSGRC